MNQGQEHVNRIREGHRAILTSIDSIQIVARAFLKARQRLLELNDVLGAHLKRQDQAFYRQLRECFDQDRESLKLIEFLICDLQDLRVTTLAFFDKYLRAVGRVSERNFPIEFAGFSKGVIARLEAEEEYLIPLMERKAALRARENKFN